MRSTIHFVSNDPLNVLVLCGGPDREHEVSLKSGGAVAGALRSAGHAVTEADLRPEDPSALDAFVKGHGAGDGAGVVFPVFHGKWGEGGGAQQVLEERGVPYVGCRPSAAALCMDKWRTKRVLEDDGLPTPESELYDGHAGATTLGPPVVIKPNSDGSSIDLALCPDRPTFDARFQELAARNDALLIERMVPGKEMTVGWVEGVGMLPPIWVRPATAFYDYDAKYTRDDTRYEFDLDEPPEVVAELRRVSERCVALLGVRHLCRVDFMLDAAGVPWVIEVNTMPGFTDHSLLPMAARRAGMEMPALCDRLVRLAWRDAGSGS